MSVIKNRELTYDETTSLQTEDGDRLPMEICMLLRCQSIDGVIKLHEWFSVPDGFIILMDRPPLSVDLYGFISENGALSEEVKLCV